MPILPLLFTIVWGSSSPSNWGERRGEGEGIKKKKKKKVTAKKDIINGMILYRENQRSSTAYTHTTHTQTVRTNKET